MSDQCFSNVNKSFDYLNVNFEDSSNESETTLGDLVESKKRLIDLNNERILKR